MARVQSSLLLPFEGLTKSEYVMDLDERRDHRKLLNSSAHLQRSEYIMDSDKRRESRLSSRREHARDSRTSESAAQRETRLAK